MRILRLNFKPHPHCSPTINIFKAKETPMASYDWSRFAKRMVIKAPIQQVYATWASANTIEQWFLSKAHFVDANHQAREAHQPIQVGDTYTWNWYGWDGQDNGHILEANGKDRIAFTFAGACKVTVALTEQGSDTLVELVQENIPLDNASMAKIHVGCTQGWTFYLANLKSVLEGGIDLRHKDAGAPKDAVNV